MRKRTNLIKKIWLMLFLCCLVGTALWNKTVHAETTYPFEKYYDPLRTNGAMKNASYGWTAEIYGSGYGNRFHGSDCLWKR